MMELIDPGTIPPGGYKYVQFETQTEVSAGSAGELVEAVRKHRKANNLPIGTNFPKDMFSEFCGKMPPGVCKGYDPNVKVIAHGTLTPQDIIRGTETLIAWTAKGFPFVDKSEADRRANICAGCPHNERVAMCYSCGGIAKRFAETIVNTIGSKSTSSDHKLYSCNICKCSNKAQAFIPLDILLKSTNKEMNDLFPEFCWKKQINVQHGDGS